MNTHTMPEQRRNFYQCHLQGRTYQEIADHDGVSKECVRYWCRRQRDGGTVQSRYRREPAGLLRRFDPKVRYSILRLQLEHPRWGPNRILVRLGKRASLSGLPLPLKAVLGAIFTNGNAFGAAQRKEYHESGSSNPNGFTSTGRSTSNWKSP
jgi:hypothetical protein